MLIAEARTLAHTGLGTSHLHGTFQFVGSGT
jgi:hypothetical protein